MSHNCPNCGKRNKISYNFCFKCGKRLKFLHMGNYELKPRESSKEFKVNNYITLKLEKDKTIIYVNNKKFIQCKYLLIKIPEKKIEDFDDVTSIDEVSEILDHSLEIESQKQEIPADLEFWGHSSNIQAWAELNYDTRLLHSNIAFPLLKKLTDVGDPNAKRVFKEEIARRFESGEKNVIHYLIIENYLDYLDMEEAKSLIQDFKERIEDELREEYQNLLDFLELKFLVDIVNDNILYSKTLKINPIRKFDHKTEKKPLFGFDLENNKISKLNLIDCELTNLSASIKNLSELKELDLDGNRIYKLPESIGELTKLKILNLANNQIKTLPDSLGNLVSLEYLILDHNILNKLPSTLNLLKNLKSLSVWNNRLEMLPENLHNLNKLQILGLSNNLLREVPESLVQLKSLYTLDLSNNLLRKLPKNIGNLQSLEILWINNNKLKDLPKSIILLNSLSRIYLFGNPLIFNPKPEFNYIRNELEEKGVIIK